MSSPEVPMPSRTKSCTFPAQLPRIAFPLLVTLLIGLASWLVPAATAAKQGSASHEFMTLLETEAGQVEAKAGEPGGILVRLNAKILQADPQQLAIPLPDGRVLVALRSASWRTGERDFTWSGELQQEASRAEGGAPGSVRFYQVGDQLYGTLQTEDGAYFELQPEGSLHRLVRFPAAAGGDPCGVGQAAGGLKRSTGVLEGAEALLAGTTETDCFVPASNTTISVMVLYPRSVTATASAMETYANTRIAEANNLFVASNVKIVYQLAHVGMITGHQPPPPRTTGRPQDPFATGPVLDWLNAQFADDGVDTEVELLRKAYGADMIVVVIPQHPAVNCGVANLVETQNGTEVLHPDSTPFADRAFAVVELDCGNGDFTFAHELGHNFGMRHNHVQEIDGDPSPRAILPWAFGHLLTLSPTSKVATVMGCYSGTGSFNACSRIGHFSNPDRTFQGVATGVHSGQAVAPAPPSHNACVANLRAPQYAGFASPPPTTPPSLTITSPAHGATVTSATTLTATATDPQDGDRRAFVQWTSDRQGALGSGSPLNVNFTRFGRHLITATVSDSSGTRIAKSIELLVSETTPPQVWIDSPAHDQQISGQFQVVGWAIDHSGVPQPPTFQVDGQTVTLTNVTRAQRADVCAAFPTVTDPNCPNVGWQGTLDTRQMTNGTHTLTMTVRDLFNNSSSTSRTFRTQNQSRVILNPIADAWVSEAQPTANFGSAVNLEMRASGSGLARHAYLKFNLAQVTRPPVSVALEVRTGTTAWDVLHVYSLATTSWDEFSVNWNNGPLDPLHHIQFGPQAANSFTNLNLTPMFPTAGGLYTLGLVTSDNPGHYFLSREGSLFTMPTLIVTY
jgi:Metallo-peptidase family M12/Bacterial Ig domain